MHPSGTDQVQASLLYVDDEPALLEIGKIYLEKSGGFSVTTALSGEDALRHLADHSFDAIVSDYQMPGGMDGITFLRHLRSAGDETPFIIFTGKGREEVVIEALNGGADFYLQKGGNPKAQFAELSNKILYAISRRRAEERLAHSHDLMHYIIEHNNAAVAVHDRDLRYIFVSQQYLDIYGVTEASVIGRHHYEVFPDLPVKWREIHRKVLAGEGVFSADDDPFPRSDGRTDWTRWECRPWYDSDGSIGGLIVYTEITTERKLAEDELRRKNEELAAAEEEVRSQLEEIITIRDRLTESNEYLENLITHANAPIIVWDQGCRITRFNDALADLTGIAPEDAIGSSPEILFPSDSRAAAMQLIEGATTGETWDAIEIPILNRTGGIRTILWNSASIRSNDGTRIIATIAQGQDITERKRSEEALADEKALLDAIFSSVPGMLYLYDTEGHLIRWNTNHERMTGYSPEELSQMNLMDWFSGDATSQAAVLEGVRRTMEEGFGDAEADLQRKDGTTIPMYFTACPLTLRGIKYFTGMGFDTTRRREAEQSFLLKDAAIESSNNGIAITDLNGILTYVNPAFLSLWGYDSHAEVIGRSATSFWMSEKAAEDVIATEKRDGTWSGELQGRRKDGSPIDIQLSASIVRDASDRPVAMMGSFIDITERKRAEAALRESEEKFRTLFEMMTVGVFYQQSDGTPVDMNSAALRLFGITREQFMGSDSYDPRWKVVSENGDPLPPDQHPSMIALRNGTAVRDTVLGVFNPERDDLVWLLVNATPQFREGETTPYQVFVTMSDITGVKAAEEALHAAHKKLQILSQVTRHDIQNRIMALQGYLILAEELSDHPQQRHYLDEVKRASGIIQDQIAFTGQYEDVGMRKPLWLPLSAMIGIIEKTRIPIRNHCSNLSIFADPMLEKVFANLLDNSIRYADGATGVEIRCEERDGDLLVIWEDDGPGIPDDQKELIFERGFGKNTGFGLFLAVEILSITGITLREAGIYGRGARFEMQVPKGGWTASSSP
ncbi:PAS domain S-box-containing protein [Methanocalculus alkaliphilus]|uniref:PAS domain S-box protein n=1 Tax=Methanocalculus alkaliphilus TaxID=768730 RepID=UPI0020A19350|nr:PAS domain S-box protein [Methanocalculus alkaliphilus]MCP1715878.1 PAS domain S-box-containing protein [Methanocalculus alkaliphilus]